MDIIIIRNILGFLLFFVFLVSLINLNFLKRKISSVRSHFKGIYISWILLHLGMIVFSPKAPFAIYLDVFSIYQISMYFLAGVIALIIFTNRIFALSNVDIALLAIILYGFLGIISGFFAPKELLTAYKASVLLVDILLVCIIVLSYEPSFQFVKKLINITYLFYVLVLLSLIISTVIKYNLALHQKAGNIIPQLRGIMPIMNPNCVGYIAAILALIFTNRALDAKKMKEKLFYGVFHVCALVVLILAQARTALIGFFCSLLMMVILKKKIMITIIICLISGIFLVNQGMKEYGITYFKRGVSETQLKTWSGRKLAWRKSWASVKESPILGYGMASGVRFGEIIKDIRIGHMHNSYFEVLLNSGSLGFIFWVMTLIIVSWNIFKKLLFQLAELNNANKSFHIEISSILMCSLIRTLTGSVFVIHDYTFVLYICFIAYSRVLTQNNAL